jgi:antitoxin component HigA of HigAB toxin-antitoxin module
MWPYTMKTKNFEAHLASRLNKQEIANIESAAKIEHESLQMLQHDISKAVMTYMTKNNVGFNDLVRTLGKSPTQVSKIIKGEANLTLATIAQLYAFMGQRAHIISS